MKTVYVDFNERRSDGFWVATMPDDLEELYEGETVVAHDHSEDVDIIAVVEWVDNELGLVLIQPEGTE